MGWRGGWVLGCGWFGREGVVMDVYVLAQRGRRDKVGGFWEGVMGRR